MHAGRSQTVVALVVAAAALLITCVFGFLSFIPGVDPDVAGFLEFGFFVGGILTMGAFVAYVALARRAASGGASTQFDRQLERRSAALGAVPVGLIAVLVGALWYLTRSLGETTPLPGPAGAAADSFAAIDTAGIVAFLGFGSMYVIVATYLAIRSERRAIVSATRELEVRP